MSRDVELRGVGQVDRDEYRGDRDGTGGDVHPFTLSSIPFRSTFGLAQPFDSPRPHQTRPTYRNRQPLRRSFIKVLLSVDEYREMGREAREKEGRVALGGESEPGRRLRVYLRGSALVVPHILPPCQEPGRWKCPRTGGRPPVIPAASPPPPDFGRTRTAGSSLCEQVAGQLLDEALETERHHRGIGRS
jgi:hypothetical protein